MPSSPTLRRRPSPTSRASIVAPPGNATVFIAPVRKTESAVSRKRTRCRPQRSQAVRGGGGPRTHTGPQNSGRRVVARGSPREGGSRGGEGRATRGGGGLERQVLQV